MCSATATGAHCADANDDGKADYNTRPPSLSLEFLFYKASAVLIVTRKST
eukprot:COSAG02_NODE_17388_length_1007_cov_1.796256_2_plen_50_part_00